MNIDKECIKRALCSYQCNENIGSLSWPTCYHGADRGPKLFWPLSPQRSNMALELTLILAMSLTLKPSPTLICNTTEYPCFNCIQFSQALSKNFCTFVLPNINFSEFSNCRTVICIPLLLTFTSRNQTTTRIKKRFQPSSTEKYRLNLIECT